MKMKTFILFFAILLTFGFVNINISHAGDPNFNTLLPDSDNDQDNYGLTAFFDLRDRESFVQVTNTNGTPLNVHVQIFNVALNCNENNFFDDYTINDTHIYNLRNILTNDGDPSGVVLPDNAYGIVVITAVGPGLEFLEANLFGNFRILDSSGYEYRTSMSGWNSFPPAVNLIEEADLTFNFSQGAGVNLSDIVGIYLVAFGSNGFPTGPGEWFADNITRTFFVADVDIFDLNENPLSCRDVAFACVQPDSPFVDEILAYDGGDGGVFNGTNGATAASLEYGINESIPHSRNGELLCPGNNINDGFVKLDIQGIAADQDIDQFLFNIYIGLNNGNGRGSMDAIWWREENNF